MLGNGEQRSIGRRWWKVAVAVAMPVSALVVGPGVAHAAGLTVNDLDHGATAQGLAQALAGPGVTVSNVSFTGVNNAAGSFAGGTGIIGFESGIVLGTGSVQTTDQHPAPCDKGVEGPNECDSNTTNNDAPGDADLTALAGFATNDATVLAFDFVPVAAEVQFRYVFTSDEYNEYANTRFNDTFAFFVNGTNCALVPGTAEPVSINTINGGNPLGTDAKHPELYINNEIPEGGASPLATEMDGLTVPLTCTATVNAGASNHMKLAIADGTDFILDANVFLEAGSLVSGMQVTTVLSGGDQTGASITVPEGTHVADQATLVGTDVATSGGTVTYTIYTDSACTAGAVSAGTKTVTNGVVPPSDSFMLPAGTYYWQAVYSGDTGHPAATSACNEQLTVSSAPTTAAPPVTLPATGSHATATAVPAALLTLSGLGLVLVARRRRRAA